MPVDLPRRKRRSGPSSRLSVLLVLLIFALGLLVVDVALTDTPARRVAAWASVVALFDH